RAPVAGGVGRGQPPAAGRRGGHGQAGRSGAEVEGDQAAAVAAPVGEDVAVGPDRLVGAGDQGRGAAAEREQAAVETDHGGGGVALGGQVAGQVGAAPGEPGAGGGGPAPGGG